MIRRYFYIFSATLFVLFTSTRGVKANIYNPLLEELARNTNSPPDGFNYQGVLRDNNGTALDEANVTMRFTLSNSEGDLLVETHSVTTTADGLVSLVIGQGTKTGGSATSFADIDWSTGVAIKVEANAGDGFVNLGTNELQSVPYAKYAENGLTDVQIEKLEALDENGEQNVNPNWDETDNTSDAFIQNKPEIPSDINELTDADGLLDGSTFDGSFESLTDVPANLDEDATDDFSGSFNDLTDVPADLADGDDVSAGVFSNTADVIFAGDADDDFVFGSDQLTDADDATKDVRMYFKKSNGAFRAGRVTGTAWDDPGDFSFAAGRAVVASGSLSTVSGGGENLATGNYSTIGGGDSNSASQDHATIAGGNNNDASNYFSSVGGGNNNDASGYAAAISGGSGNEASEFGTFVGGGVDNVASSQYATVTGGYSNASEGDFTAISGGKNNISDGNYSTIGGGYENRTSGDFSFVGGGKGNRSWGTSASIPGGHYLNAKSFAQTVIGTYNTDIVPTSSTAFVNTDPIFVIGNGADNANLSDALVMLKNGNTTINGELTLSDGANPITFPNTDGSSGQVLSTDGSGALGWTNAGGAFSNTANVIFAGDADDDFVFGSAQLSDAGNADEDNRVYFDKSSGSFRAGSASSTEWDSPGLFSFAAGRNNTASGSRSTVGGGESNTAAVSYSTVAGGRGNVASQSYTTIGGGRNNDAENSFAFVGGGDSNFAEGTGTAISGGLNNTASGGGSFVGGGLENTANGAYSVIAGGYQNVTQGNYSFIGGGYYNVASGNHSSIPGGDNLLAESFAETVIGTYNTDVTPNSTTTFNSADRLFVIGNGTGPSRSDAMVVMKSGNTDVNGSLVATSLGVDGQFTLPTSDGADGQVLSTDGSGTVSWATIVPTIVTSTANAVTVPDDVKEYILSHDGSQSFVVTMPTSSNAGDKIQISVSTGSPSNGEVSFSAGSGSATILSTTPSTFGATMNLTNPTIIFIYDGTTWLLVKGELSAV
ncbi:hypothetical protein SAMN04488029_1720 [Reichenbachiella faecimaris]|uniref:Head domain of trimeric autotransporter adhesin n=1 Tax=Reichenbachiella faecimaris TaxID=692418 RepID=A0A1W2GB39_REIFA|nr:hypothetical protein [Reichenbachiella faecimaris]SMD33877.1 hypothetical protein SAMN04488029_1720 [Reichenbachiella faecimaris]